jgi:hypothetical protein
MEAFEHVVKVYLEARGFIVTNGVKFPIVKEIVKQDGRKERQTHGYEADLVAARAGQLQLASVKSFFGSRGVNRQGFEGIADEAKRTHFGRYRMFNDLDVRNGMVTGACERYGYSPSAIRMALYVGKFAAADEGIVRQHLSEILVGGAPVDVIGLDRVVAGLLSAASDRMYINDPVLMTLKALHAAGMIQDSLPPDIAAAVEALDRDDADLDEGDDDA